MPHGTPDWGFLGPKTTTYGLDDLGEHAVRLGSPVLFDRRGDVMWMSDFRNGMGDLEIFGVPAGGAVSLWAGYARQGAFCVRLMPTLGNDVSVRKWLPYPVLSRIGLEFSFNVDFQTDYIRGYINADDGLTSLRAWIRYDEGNNLLQYYDYALVPAWITFATNINLPFTEYCPQTLKMVIDLQMSELVRVILNNYEYSLRGVPLGVAVTGGVPILLTAIEHQADAFGDADCSIDNVIVTQNEP